MGPGRRKAKGRRQDQPGRAEKTLIYSVRGEPGRTMNGVNPIKSRAFTPLRQAQDRLRYAPDGATQGERVVNYLVVNTVTPSQPAAGGCWRRRWIRAR